MEPRTLRTALEQVRGRLRALFALYGGLLVVGIAAAGLLVAFALDRLLSLPVGVRLFFLAAIAGLVVLATLRGIVYPLRKRIRAEDIALAVERRFDELDGGLISTLELDGEALAQERNISEDLVLQHRAAMDARLRGIDFGRIFDYRALRRVAAAALVLLAVDLTYAAMNPEVTRIFVERLFGRATRWPQRTMLFVEFPESAGHFFVEAEDGRPRRVRIARGASLPVTVRAEGEQPEFVELRSDGAARVGAVSLAPTGGTEWVGRYRNVRDSFTFWPHGGDDDGGGREVSVDVLPPPSIASVATTIEFPAYTGLGTRTQPRGDVEAPVGSIVTLAVEVREELQSASIVFESGTGELPLAAPADGSAVAAWTATFPVVESSAYAIHLVGANGFRNLEPATYAIIAVKDRAPTVKVLEPAQGDIDITPQGLVPLRVAAADDYGVASLDVAIGAFGAEARHSVALLDPSAPIEKQRLVYTLVDLSSTPLAQDEAGAARAAAAGDSYVYTVAAADNHATADGVGPNRIETAARRIDVISPNEMLRTLAERQIRRKDDVLALRELQLEKLERLKGLLADYEASEGDVAPEPSDLAALEIGQAQVTSRATRLTSEFAALYETYLLNRLDGSAAAERLIPLLVERKRSSTVLDGFDFGVYEPIVLRYERGEFGQLDVLGRLIDMLSCILAVANGLSPSAGEAIGDARLMVDATERPARIRDAVAAQEEALRRIDALLEKMDEWEDFQEILTLFRGLVDDQRSINAQTSEVLRASSTEDR